MDYKEKMDLMKTIEKLEIENNVLREKIKNIYVCWLYDYKRFTELKEFHKGI